MSLTFHTTHGDLKIELHCDKAPLTAYNFLALAASGAYNGTHFLRNIQSFLIQGGDTTGTGKGGECIWGGLMEDEFTANLRHDSRGVVSMASSKPDEVGSQFFITYAAQSHLDGKQSVVGKVLFGWDTLDKMERVPVKGKKYRPQEDMSILNTTIHANPFAEANKIFAAPENRKPKKELKVKTKKKTTIVN
jgi:peptidyl-prolyl cis-trans isomerase-like 3